MKLYVGGRPTFFTFFSDFKNMTFYVFLSCCTRFLEHCGHVLRKDDDDWEKKCMEYEVEGPRPRGRPRRTWTEVVQEDCQAR